jgi:CPA2 family monovalent cation:H+ antiporter-2
MVLLVVIVGKPLSAFITVRALGTPMATALPVSAAFSQVGEFSFILGTVARQLGLVTDIGWDALVAASIISIALNPTVYCWARRRATPTVDLAPAAGPERPAIDPRRSILVGYGPVGRIVHRLLTDRGADVTVVDLNLETVRRLRDRGVKAVYGDVLRRGTLDEAGIATASSLVLSADVEDAAEIVRQARLYNPDLRVLARCAHLRDATALRRAGASVVAAGEAEVGVALAEAVTAGDALDPVQASAQRDAFRARLYDAPPGE